MLILHLSAESSCSPPNPKLGGGILRFAGFQKPQIGFEIFSRFLFFSFRHISRILYFCCVLVAWLCCRTPFPVLFTGMLCPIFPSAVLNVIIELS